MGILNNALWAGMGFAAGVAYRDRGGTIDWQRGEALMRGYVQQVPGLFEDAVRLAKAQAMLGQAGPASGGARGGGGGAASGEDGARR